MTSMQQGRQKGFSLIELLIALVIVGILAGIAYNAYINNVDQSRRADAQSSLMQAAQRLERCYTVNNEYEDCMDDEEWDSEDGYYRISKDVQDGGQSFTLRADPQGAQERDTHACEYFELDSDGSRRAAGNQVDDEYDGCWDRAL